MSFRPPSKGRNERLNGMFHALFTTGMNIRRYVKVEYQQRAKGIEGDAFPFLYDTMEKDKDGSAFFLLDPRALEWWGYKFEYYGKFNFGCNLTLYFPVTNFVWTDRFTIGVELDWVSREGILLVRDFSFFKVSVRENSIGEFHITYEFVCWGYQKDKLTPIPPLNDEGVPFVSEEGSKTKSAR